MTGKRPPRRLRSSEQIAADRAAILPLCDGTLTVKEIAADLGRYPGDVWGDVIALRRDGHEAPVRVPALKGEVAVYRQFAADGRLLYVGCTSNPLRRMEVHASKSRWFREIARIEIEWFDSGDEALAAELEAIRTEGPVHNVRGVPHSPLPLALLGEPHVQQRTQFRVADQRPQQPLDRGVERNEGVILMGTGSTR